MQQVHIDLITSLPMSMRGNVNICVMVDAMTGYLTVDPLADKSALTVAEAFVNNIMLHFGCPEVIVSDNGTEFTNNIMRAVDHLLHMRHQFTVPYNPQSNGKVEKRNSTITQILTGFVQAHQQDWDLYLPLVAWAYNTTINVATGYTPFRAVFGREARTPACQWISEFRSNHCRDLDDYVSRIAAVLEDTWSDIAKRTAILHHKAAHQQRDSQRPFRPYIVGEQFFFKSVPRRTFKSLEDEHQHKISRKLQYRYSGPHTIVGIINPLVYRATIDGVVRTVHCIRMKRDPRKRPPIINQAAPRTPPAQPMAMTIHCNESPMMFEHYTSWEEQIELKNLPCPPMEEEDDPLETVSQYYSIHEMSFSETVARHEMSKLISPTVAQTRAHPEEAHFDDRDQLEQCFQRIHLTSQLSNQSLLANIGIVTIPLCDRRGEQMHKHNTSKGSMVLSLA